MKRTLSFLTLILLFVTAGVYAQPNILNPNDSVYDYNSANPPATPANGTMGKWVRTVNRITWWNTNKFKPYIWNGMAFRLRFPNGYNPSDKTKKYPVIVFLHGAGEIQPIYDNEDQMYWGAETFQNKIDSGQFNAFLLFPQVSATAWDYSYYQRINSVLDTMQKYTQADPDRVIAMGLSNGAFGAMSYAAGFPQRISTVIASSPALIQLIQSYIPTVIHIPTWLASGGLDTSPGPDVMNTYTDTFKARGGDIRYTFYPDLGHGTWTQMWSEPYLVPYWNNAHTANPLIYNKASQYCPIAVTAKMGITQGFAEYQWQLNGVTIPNATTNDIIGTQLGSYRARFRRVSGGDWSDWSQVPAVITALPATVTPGIKITGTKSVVLPAPDGSTTTPLELPAGYNTYEWRKASDSTLVSTARTFAAPVGQYIAKATNCNSTFTPVFSIINATGGPKPDSARNLVLTRLNATSIKLDWADVANPVTNETGFEIYRASASGGPYTMAGLTGADVKTFTDTAISSNYNFYYRIRSVSATGAAGLSNEATLQPGTDVTVPTVPTNLKAVFTSRNYIDLEWTAATDNVGVTAYDVYVNGTKRYTSTVAKISADSLTPNTAYTFTVVARDQAGNVSSVSTSTAATTKLNGLKYHYYEGNWSVLPDFSTLTAVASGQTANVDISVRPANVIQNYGFVWEGFINIKVPGSYTFETSSDDGSKFYYNTFYSPAANALVNNDGVHGASPVTGTVNIPDTGLHPIAITYFQQASGQSMQVYWTGPGITRQLIPSSAFTETFVAPSDSTAPSAPATLKAAFTSRTYVDLTWTASTDNVGVTAYDVYVNNVKKYTTTATAITADSLTPNTSYSFIVKARDFAGNTSAASNTLVVTASATGLKYKYYEGTWNAIPDFSVLTPVKTGSTPNVDITVRPAGVIQNYGFVWEGYINIRAAGSYTFETVSDDGSRLYYNSSYSPYAIPTVNNDGIHGAISATGTVNITDTGLHPIAISYFQQSSGQSMQVYWTGPGIARQLIPDSAFTQLYKTQADTSAPTVPGNLTAGFIGNTSINLTWNASTDNIAVVAYDVYVAGVKKYTSLTNSLTADSLSSNTTYTFTVKARDFAGNTSAASNAITAKTTTVASGLNYKYYQGSWSALPDFTTLTPVKTGVSANVDISVRTAGVDDNFGFVWQGYINLPTAGTYTFETVSDDGSKLYFNSLVPTATPTVSNDGLHGPTTVTGNVTVAAAGYYPINIAYFEKDGGQSMQVYYTGPGITRQLIPDAAFTTSTLKTDTVAPSVPLNLKAVSVTTTTARLAWGNSTDNIGVTGYDVFINGTKKYTTVTDSVTITSLKADSSFIVAVRAFDSSGNNSALSVPLTVKAASFKDTTAPTVPLNLKVVSVTTTTARLAWSNSTDSIGVTGYDVFINGIKKYTTVTDSVTIASLKADSSFSVAVRAFDSSGNNSALSVPLIVKAASFKDTTAPTVPLNLKVVSVTTATARLAWSNSTDSIGVAGYDVFINGIKKYTTVTDSVTIVSLKADSSFSVAVRAFDSSGNNSALSVPLTVKAASFKDTTAPTVPLNLKVVSVTTTTARLAWSNATDSVGVAGYDVFINGIKKYTTVTDSVTIASLKADSSFSVAVRAFDSAGNNSALSVPLTVKAASFKDTTAPTVPLNLKVVSVTTTTARLAWSNSTDSIGVTGYDVFINGTKQYTTATDSITIASLKADSSFSVAVRAFDSSGNASALSVPLTVKAASVKDTTAPTVPTNVAATLLGLNSINLVWTASTDSVGVVAYDVYVNGIKKYSSATNSITADSLTSNTSYSFTVKARDLAGNMSAASIPLVAKTAAPATSAAGLTYKYYQGTWSVLPDFTTLPVVNSGTTPNVDINIRPAGFDDNFGFVWQGYINIPVAGSYTFETISDDGSKLYFNSLYVPTATATVNNDGLHAATSVTGNVTVASAGYYPIAITYFEKDGGQSMQAYWSGPGIPRQLIPNSAFLYQLAADTIPPSVPTNVAVAQTASSFLNLTWTASTDNVGVAGYDVYVNGTKKYSTSTNSVTADSLALGTTYSFTVKARDVAGNVSAASAVLTAATSSSASGLRYKYYQGTWSALPDFTTLPVVKSGTTPNVDISIRPAGFDDNFAFVWEGYISIPVAGTYTFETVSDDGSKLYFNSQYVQTATALVNNDGLHGATTVTGAVTVATAGYYPIAITYFEKDGGQSMQVYWSGPGVPRQLIPNSAFVYQLAADTTAPSAPTGVTAALANSTFINLTWTASTDNVGVSGYDVYLNGTKKYSTTTNSVTADSLTAATSYTFTVKARDFAGNASAFSAPLTTSTTAAPSGLTYKYYEGNWDVLPNFSALTALKTGFTPNVDIITVRNVSDYYGFVWEGNITLPTAGTYTFETISDDGSKLYFNQKYSPAATALVSNDGVHGPISATGNVTMAAGTYPIAITFFEKNSGESMQVYWTGPGIARQLIPNSAFAGTYTPPVDSVAPSVPANVKALLTTSTYVDIAWDASTDNIGVTGYDIYVNGVKKTTVTATNYRLTGLTAGQSNTFTIKAVDLANNMSAFSTALATVSAPKANGLKYRYYEGNWDVMPNFDALTPVKTGSSPTVDISVRPAGVNYYYGFVWEGYINITTPGTYTFETVSDDGSKFYWNTLYNSAATPLVNNDGLHAAISGSASVNVPTAGLYPISVTYFQKDGGGSMDLYYTGPGISRQLVPGTSFKVADDGTTQGTGITTTAIGSGLYGADGTSDALINANVTKAYPNPFTETINIQYSSSTPSNNVSVGVYDMGGRLVQRRMFGSLSAGINALNVSLDKQMIPGMYLVKLDVGGKLVKMWKMIKERK